MDCRIIHSQACQHHCDLSRYCYCSRHAYLETEIHPPASAILCRQYNCSSDLSCETHHPRHRGQGQHSTIYSSSHKHHQHYTSRVREEKATPSSSHYTGPSFQTLHQAVCTVVASAAMDDESLHPYQSLRCQHPTMKHSIAMCPTRYAYVYERWCRGNSYRTRGRLIN